MGLVRCDIESSMDSYDRRKLGVSTDEQTTRFKGTVSDGSGLAGIIIC